MYQYFMMWRALQLDMSLVKLLKCPSCGDSGMVCDVFKASDSGEVTDGILRCKSCGSSFIIENGLLELLTGNLVYSEERSIFHEKYGVQAPPQPSQLNSQTSFSQSDALQKQQQAYFDTYSHNDDLSYTSYEQQPFWLAADKIAFTPWRRMIKPGSLVLDIGCAQGRSTFKLMDLDITVVGFDISKRLVRLALDRYRQGHFKAKASFFAADALQLPFADCSFDYVLIYGVLHHLPEVGKVCGEIARVLKPGGIYLGQENNHSVFRGIFDFLQRIHPLWQDDGGPEAIISQKRIHEAFEHSNVLIKTKTSLFLPPHLINLLPKKAGYLLLKLTDALCRHLPFLKEQGGVIIMEVTKRP